MTALVSYSTGTVSVAAGGTIVTGVGGAIWSDTNARPGDIFQIGNFQSVISDKTDTTHLVIPPWGGGAQAGVAYKIWQVSPQRFAGSESLATVNKLVAAFNTSGFFVFVDIDATDPDPSLGDDGQFAFQPTTGKTWAKSAGVWAYLGIYKAFQLKGAWSGATAYAAGDVVTLSGSSYVCVLDHTNHTPPNVTYWQLLASAGTTGATPLLPVSAWVTATAYVVGPPASYVTNGGSSYMCLVSHTSGTFATDLAAGKWGLVSQKGTDGAGYGGTSTTSRTIGTGSQAFTTQAGLAYTNGARVRASSAASTSNWMEGLVTYSGTTLTIAVDRTNGSGALADWNFNVVGQPGAGDLSSANNLSDVANASKARQNLGIPGCLRGHIGGLTLSTAGSSTTFGIAAGVATDSTSADTLTLASAYTKTTSAWAVGTGNGAWDGGGTNPLSGGNASWYHVFLIKRPDTGVTDILLSQNATSPNLPSNYTLFRRIGSLKMNGAGLGQLAKFFQNGDEFIWDAPIADASALAITTSVSTITLTVPTGVMVSANIQADFTNSGGAGSVALIYSATGSAQAAGTPTGNWSLSNAVASQFATNAMTVLTNTSAQVNAVGGSGSGNSLYVITKGWIDSRGRFS
ncbi:hypothetical protein ACT4MK_10130 [Bradyrhizobium barranii]|uniref:hypothetical protein n=1 Tax=Bradyrhizobium TaxID=374 RepID=UPI003F299796